MNDAVRRFSAALLLLAACAPPAARAQFGEEADLAEVVLSGKTPESIIILWPTYSYRLARMMIAKYGQPAESSDHSLVWKGNGQWTRTVVYRDPPGARALEGGRGRLEQSVAYKIPERRLGELARFDKGVEADLKEGWLTARSDDEGENFLALNLADEVLKGRRTPREATEFRRNASRLRDAGKASPYFDRLLFAPGVSPANPAIPD